MTEKQKAGLSVYNKYYNRDYRLDTDEDYEILYGAMTTRSHIIGCGFNENIFEDKKAKVLERLEEYEQVKDKL